MNSPLKADSHQIGPPTLAAGLTLPITRERLGLRRPRAAFPPVGIWNWLLRFGSVLLLGFNPVSAVDLNPRLIGSWEGPKDEWGGYATLTSVAVAHSQVFGTSWSGELWIIDVTDPANPRLLAAQPTSGIPNQVVISGDHAYVAAEPKWNGGGFSGGGLYIFDITDPTAPRRVGYIQTAESAYGLFLSGAYAYVADGQAGLAVIDISNPARPRRVGGLDAPGDGEVHGVVVSGDYAYLADRFWEVNGFEDRIGAFRVVDVSDPANPRFVAHHRTAGQAWNLAVAGNTAYVGATELEVFDISDPANPRRIGSYGAGGAVAVTGDRVIVGATAMIVFDATNPAALRRIGGYTLGANAMTAVGRYAYLADDRGFQIIDLDSPANLPRFGGVDTPGDAQDVAVSGTRAYIADSAAGMQILDITDSAHPLVIGNYPTPDPAALVAVHGDYAYLVETWWLNEKTYGYALNVLDVREPSGPIQKGIYVTFGNSPTGWESFTFAISKDGSFGYLAIAATIDIIDLRDPADPKPVGAYSPDTRGYSIFGIALHEHYLVVGQQGLAVIDVSNPANPSLLSEFPMPDWIARVVVSGTRAYATSVGGFHVFDLTTPTQPQILGTTDRFGRRWNGLAVSGNYVYGSAGGSGVQVVDVSDPANPRLVGGNAVVWASDLAISENGIFVAGLSDGLQVFDLTPVVAEPPPALVFTRSGSTLTLSWPASAIGFALEASETLVPATNWAPEATAPVVVGDQNVVTIEIGSGSQFFRLHKP